MERMAGGRWRHIFYFYQEMAPKRPRKYPKTFKEMTQNLQGNDPKPSRKWVEKTKENPPGWEIVPTVIVFLKTCDSCSKIEKIL
jgi:hypothetical protein